jgi:hypothetical protein
MTLSDEESKYSATASKMPTLRPDVAVEIGNPEKVEVRSM